MLGRSAHSSGAGGGAQSEWDGRSETGTDSGGKRNKLAVIGDKVKKMVNTDVDELFGDVGELVEEYPCALESGILRQGKMFVTNRFICFFCSHFGKEKKIRIPYKQVADIKKENTAMVIPNAISIRTRQTEYMFRSFLRRDECHSLLTAMWKNFKDIEKSGGGGHHTVDRAEEPAAPAVVKIVYDHYNIQLLRVAVSPSPGGKKGHSYSLDIFRGKKEPVHTVTVDIGQLKGLHDAMVDSNPLYGDLITFPSQSFGGFTGMGKLTPQQLDERTAQLNTWMERVLTSLSPGALVLSSSPPPYVIPNPLAKDPYSYPAMSNGIKDELAVLFDCDVASLEPVTVQLPQSRSRDDIGPVHIEAALEAADEPFDGERAEDKSCDNTAAGTVEQDHSHNGDAEDAPKVVVSVGRFTAKGDKIGLSKKILFQTDLQLELHSFSVAKEFGDYRKLYEDLRMRGIGYDVRRAVVDAPAPGEALPLPAPPRLDRIDSGSSSQSDSSSEGDSGFGAESTVGEKKPKVKEIFSNLLSSKPTRHGSFSEIEIDVELSCAFPPKFHHKLTSKDLSERCTLLDAWVRTMLSQYHSFSLESKDIVNNFLGLGDTMEAERLMHLINIIDRITHPAAVDQTIHHAGSFAMSVDSTHSDMTSLTAGTASHHHKEGGAGILKSTVAAIGSLVQLPAHHATAAVPAERVPEHSTRGDDSAHHADASSSSSDSSSSLGKEVKEPTVKVNGSAVLATAGRTQIVDVHPASDQSGKSDTLPSKNNANPVAVPVVDVEEKKESAPVPSKDSSDPPKKPAAIGDKKGTAAAAAMEDEKYVKEESSPLPPPKGCCVVS